MSNSHMVLFIEAFHTTNKIKNLIFYEIVYGDNVHSIKLFVLFIDFANWAAIAKR